MEKIIKKIIKIFNNKENILFRLPDNMTLNILENIY